MLYEKASAKINLTLDVLRRREDGYHEVEMVMTTVDLSDRLSFSKTTDGKITIRSSAHFVPEDQRNLAYQAAALLQKRYNVSKGVSIHIDKKIPVAAGLAGGSADAAATLRGLNRLWNLHLSLDELASIATEIGSDVAFCVYGGTAVATGRGEKVQSIPAPPNCWVVLAKPNLSVSTGSIYTRLSSEQMGYRSTDKMVTAIQEQNYEEICRTTSNALESVTLNLHPEVRQLKEKMEDFGVDVARMSGSGPTVYGLVKNEFQAQRIYNALKGFCEEVYAVRLDGERTYSS